VVIRSVGARDDPRVSSSAMSWPPQGPRRRQGAQVGRLRSGPTVQKASRVQHSHAWGGEISPNSLFFNYYSNNLLEWIPMAHIDARDLPAPFVHGCLMVWYT
jgi:hypothetical protein